MGDLVVQRAAACLQLADALGEAGTMVAQQELDPGQIRGAAKLLVEAWDQWVSGPEAELDEADNPVPVADDCTTYQPVWPFWPSATL